MQLKQLISTADVIEVQGPVDREVVGIAYDSRRITPGMIFVAIPGLRADGNDYILSAIERGALAIITSKDVYVPGRVTKVVVKDPRLALAQFSCAFYQNPSASMRLIGVTGTNGKTTISFILRQMLEAVQVKTGLLGTIRYEVGDRIIPAQRTTPESLEVQQMLSQMARSGCKAAVMEVSSHALEQKRVWGIEFDIVIFSNLTQDHLDYHGTMEAYYEAKRKLFTGSKDSHKRRSAIINIDDRFGEKLFSETDAQIIVSYGLGKKANISANHIELGSEGTRMHVVTPKGEFDCRLPLIGRHNVYNALAAVGAGIALNIPIPDIQNTLAQLGPVPGRFECIHCEQPFNVLVDYAHSDDALKNVLQTLREITDGKILLVFGCGGSRDKGKRAIMGRVAASLANYTIITSDNPRKESAESIAAMIREGYTQVRSDGYHIELDRRRAIDEAIRMARPSDAVLIAGKGHEIYQEFEDTVIPFDDRICARETLETMGFGKNRKNGSKWGRNVQN